MACWKALHLLEAYCDALPEFHDARRLVKEISRDDPEFPVFRKMERDAFLRLYTARQRYWSHVKEHGCREPVGAPESRLQIESRLRNEMKEARLKFLAASDEYDYLIRVSLDCPATTDGHLAREQASRLNAALKTYHAALQRYASFIVGDEELGESSARF